MTVKITSGVLRDSLFLNFGYILTNHSKSVITAQSHAAVHPDLKEAFRQLLPHLVLLCEMENARRLNPYIEDISILQTEPEKQTQLEVWLSNFEVQGFKLIGNEGEEIYEIIGTRKLENDKILKLVTPRARVTDEYAYPNHLRAALYKCAEEVEEYLRGKVAINPQLPIEFADQDETAKGDENGDDDNNGE